MTKKGKSQGALSQLSTKATDLVRRINLPARIIKCEVLRRSSSELWRASVPGTSGADWNS